MWMRSCFNVALVILLPWFSRGNFLFLFLKTIFDILHELIFSSLTGTADDGHYNPNYGVRLYFILFAQSHLLNLLSSIALSSRSLRLCHARSCILNQAHRKPAHWSTSFFWWASLPSSWRASIDWCFHNGHAVSFCPTFVDVSFYNKRLLCWM